VDQAQQQQSTRAISSVMDDGHRVSALEQAAASGDVALLREAAAGPDLAGDEEARAESVRLALRICCEGTHWDAVRFLVKEGVVDLACPESASAVLQHSAAAGCLDILKLAEAQGAKLASEAGAWAALAAAVSGQLEAMIFLVEAGADVREEGGRAALSAAKVGHWQASEYLLEAGGNLNLQPEGAGVQLLALAAVADKPALVEKLRERGVTVASPEGMAALLAMGSSMEWEPCREASRYLVENGVEVCSDAGSHALLTAAKYGDVDMVKLLVAHGVDTRSPLAGEAVARAGELGPPDSGAAVAAFLSAHGAVAPPPPKLVIDEDF